VQSRLRSIPPARTKAQIEKDTQGQGASNPTAGGRYSQRVPYPSNRTRQYTGLNWMRMNVPSNWRDFTAGDSVQFAPEGAYGDQGITHGALVGIYQGRNRDLGRDSQEYLNGAMLSGRSPITGRNEVVTIYTAQLRSGDLLYIATVVPENESGSYSYTFRNMLSSLRLYDQSL
jgi:hypothetical protein